MKRKLFIIAIIINFHYVTLNTSRGNVFEQLLEHWLDVDGDAIERGEYKEAQCHIDVNHKLSDTRRQSPQPLFIHSGTSKFFHPTDQSGIIIMRKYERIELFCTDGFASSSSSSSSYVTDRNLVTIACSGNDRFQIVDDDDDEILSLNNFKCRKHPRHTARRRQQGSKSRCFNNGSLVDIGFQVDNKRFLQVMTVCHDPKRQQTYYAKYSLTPANIAAQRAIKRPSFIQSDFFPGKDINLLYGRKHQRAIIPKLIMGDEMLSDDDPTIFLSRGHLAAKADFIYGNEQRATFYYINVMPQWQTFNSLNWLAVEDGSRRLAADRNITLTVYTGTTHDTTELKDVEGKSTEVYLDMVHKQIPIPKLFYKILINAKANSGIALICVNNVHISIEEIHRDYVICEDISDDITYIKWKKKEVRRGYCYACRVDEFLAKVPHLNGTFAKTLLT